jgi:hypothetical protein
VSRRPRTVVAAVAVALLVALTGLASSLWWLVLAGQRPGAPVLGLTHDLGVLFLGTRLVVAAVEVLLVVGMWRGRRAARTAQTVWSVLVVGAVLLSTVTGGAAGSKAGVTGFVGVVGSAAVLVLLWLPPSRAWFGERRHEGDDPLTPA